MIKLSLIHEHKVLKTIKSINIINYIYKIRRKTIWITLTERHLIKI